MKKYFTFLLAISMIAIGHAQGPQTLSKFRLDIRGGLGDIDKNESNKDVQSYAWLISIEPNYNFNDYTSAGLHYYHFEAFNGHSEEVSLKRNNIVMAGLMLTSPTKLSSWWFAGVNAGVNFYTNKPDTAFFPVAADKKPKYSGTGLAFMPHGGFQYGRITLDVAYLLSGNTGNHYMTVSLGFYLGGGKKRS